MVFAEILKHIERLRNTDVGMSNYTTVLNDAFVIMRELTEQVQDLAKRVDQLETEVDPIEAHKP